MAQQNQACLRLARRPSRRRLSAIRSLSALLTGVCLAPTGLCRAAPTSPADLLARPSVVETTFKSVDATVAAQWDFPKQSPAPLVVLIPSAGAIDRNGLPPGVADGEDKGAYQLLTEQLVAQGFAVFRYDKPGTGRSSRGAYSTGRSTALEAYRRAVDHARIDRKHIFLLGHSSGTDDIAGIYSRYETIAPLAGVVLLSSRVSEVEIIRITAPVLIVVGEHDPDDLYKYGRFAQEARENARDKTYETDFVSIPDARHSLLAGIETKSGKRYAFDPRATSAVLKWLQPRSNAVSGNGADAHHVTSRKTAVSLAQR